MFDDRKVLKRDLKEAAELARFRRRGQAKYIEESAAAMMPSPLAVTHPVAGDSSKTDAVESLQTLEESVDYMPAQPAHSAAIATNQNAESPRTSEESVAALPPPPPAHPAGRRNRNHKKVNGALSRRESRGPCNLLGCCGFAPQAITRNGRAPWLQPAGGVDVGLMCHNSLTNQKERFVPLDGKKVRWYTCGPTVYDVAHMGHARAYLTFDILRRIMVNYFNYDVCYQINITDIDDKIIMRSRQNKLMNDFVQETMSMDLERFEEVVDEAVEVAANKLAKKRPEVPGKNATEKERQEYCKLLQEHVLKAGQMEELKRKVAAAKGNKDQLIEAAKDPIMAKLDKERGHTVNDHSVFAAHARHFEQEYFEDMDALGVLRPDNVTRISDYMDGRVQDYIERLVVDGFAYESNGSVYFSIDGFRKEGYEYRKLNPAAATSAAEMAEGEGALVDETVEKRNPSDFALWKKSKPGEPAWDSKWGKGRPGWHIECSVMADDVHEEYLDIHGGGEDLKFPHHDNEMAQSEAYNGRPQWTNYFLHAGHLSIEGLKMSKSLKNFITIRQALETHSARQLRLMFLMQSWDKGMNYSDQAIEMARVEEKKMKHFLGSLRFYLRRPHGTNPSDDANLHREKALEDSVKSSEEAIGAALRDNFNTSKVIEILSRLIGECYDTFGALPGASLEPVKKAAELVERILHVLGIEGLATQPANEEAWTNALDAFAALRQHVRQLALKKAPASHILAALDVAAPSVVEARAAGLNSCAEAFGTVVKDLRHLASNNSATKELLEVCDRIRDKVFVNLGVRLEDLRVAEAGFVWMFDDREVLKRDLAEAAELARFRRRGKTQGIGGD
jgi:cysteinyl-tRNA synthetase